MANSRMLQPPPVKPGDCIGLFTPAGPVRDQERYNAGMQLLHELGFRTKLYPEIAVPHAYLAADDQSRAREFHAMWTDPEVHAMLAVRGGYGCLRLLPHLDLELLRQNPKLVIGFSDLTVLLNALVERVGIIALHGPVLTSLAGSDRLSIDSFVSHLTGTAPGEMAVSGLEVLRGGSARGTIRGGNLTTIAHLLGTPWEIPCQNTILLLEDTGEPMYRIDRILTQLHVSGRLDNLAGLLLGSFDCTTDKSADKGLEKEVWVRILELTVHSDYPIWGNFPVGHLRTNQTIPIGASATMDSAAGTLRVDDNFE